MRRHSDTFSVELERLNDATHLRLAGRFDVAATPLLDETIGVIRRRDVILDLDAVTFMEARRGSRSWHTKIASTTGA